MAKAYPEYLKAPKNNSVVGVVVQVAALSPEWNVQRIKPGALLVGVNGKALKGSLQESLAKARFITFEMNGEKFNKLVHG